MNGYELSRAWFDFCFENPELIKPNHTALYFFAIEHCNRLGWKEKFGFPSQMAMEALGIKNWRTYSKCLNELVEFGFIKMIETSKNQYSSNIIAIVKTTKATTKALDKALQKHDTKQGQSIDSIVKQETIEQETIEQYSFDDFWDLYNKKIDRYKCLSKWNKIKDIDKSKILKHIPEYLKSQPETKYRKNPLTYLNGQCWNDEIMKNTAIDEKYYIDNDGIKQRKLSS